MCARREGDDAGLVREGHLALGLFDDLPVEPPLCLEKVRHGAKAFENVTKGIYNQSRRVDCKAHRVSYIATLDSRGKRDVAKLEEQD